MFFFFPVGMGFCNISSVITNRECQGYLVNLVGFYIDLPQVDCEMRDKESEGRSRETQATKSRVASRLVPPAEY